MEGCRDLLCEDISNACVSIAVIIEMGVKNGPPFLCGNFATGIRCVKD
jgi:hypothetical protein